MAKKKSTKKVTLDRNQPHFYELEVMLLSGPITETFAKANKCVQRTIQIRSNQTLEVLHEAIFDAFDRYDDHMYEFQVGGKGPMDPKARRYILRDAMDEPYFDGAPAGDVSRTQIGTLGLKVNETFGYWFDFGDNWWHQITVTAIHDALPDDVYPKLTSREGDSPPQYVDWDDPD